MIGAGNDKQVGLVPHLHWSRCKLFHQFQLFAEKILRQPELCHDPRFSTNGARVANREVLVKIITETLVKKPLDHWLKLFDGLG